MRVPVGAHAPPSSCASPWVLMPLPPSLASSSPQGFNKFGGAATIAAAGRQHFLYGPNTLRVTIDNGGETPNSMLKVAVLARPQLASTGSIDGS